MTQNMMFLAAFVVFLVISVGAAAVLWLVMPFSVFGVKDLIKKLLEEQEKTNAMLKSLVDAAERGAKDADDRAAERPVDKGERVH